MHAYVQLTPPSLAVPHASCVSPASRKPRGYWADKRNLSRELRQFATQAGSSHDMPTASQLLAAGRVDLCRAVQRHGGFTGNARHMGLTSVRRPRINRPLFFVKLHLAQLVQQNLLQPHVMPSAHQLRSLGRSDLISPIVAAGGFLSVATKLSLLPAHLTKRKSLPLSQSHFDHWQANPEQQLSASLKRKRRQNYYWNQWRNLETELHTFSERYCNGYMPLQRQLLDANRSDLLNAVRHHGGVATVARRAALAPAPSYASKRPHGYWSDPAVLHAQLLTFIARNGNPGLMPTRHHLREAGRADIAYAIEKHGGYSSIAAQLHLVWHGPCSYWRLFRNVQRRLLAYVRRKHLKSVMPSLDRLHKDGRNDLVHGIAMHGGVMVVAQRTGLHVVFPHRPPEYWEKQANIQRELQGILRLQPLEVRKFMPSSVALVQMGRVDLAAAIRDHGGWIYYAQQLGLRFAFEVRAQGFWQREENVVLEIRDYMQKRYGSWEHPGRQLDGEANDRHQGENLMYIPAIDMLKRDGRSDIAFAIDRYHDGIEEFAARNGFQVADDVIHTMPVGDLLNWKRFARALRMWISAHGSNGIMPSKQDLIRTGRHDLRYATYTHAGTRIVAKRLQLCFIERPVDQWLPGWLSLQAAKFGLVLSSTDMDFRKSSSKSISRYQRDLDSSVVGQYRRIMTTTVRRMVHDRSERDSARRRWGPRSKQLIGAKKKGDPQCNQDKFWRMSRKELEKLRARYRHVQSDDIITI